MERDSLIIKESHKKLVIFGTSDIARCAYEYFTHDSDYRVVGFTIDKAFLEGQESFMGLPLVAFEELENHFPPEVHHAFAAIGSHQLNRTRTEKYQALKNRGYKIASYISSRAFIWHNVQIGEHAFILENNTIQPFVQIGSNVTLWSGNHIGHSSVIEDNCFIASQVVISGLCKISQNSFVGVNATISEGVTIGRDNFIGMSAIIGSSTQDDQIIAPRKTEPSTLSAKRFCKVKEKQ